MTTIDPTNLQAALTAVRANRQQFDDFNSQLATLTGEIQAFKKKGDLSDPDAILGAARRLVTADTIPRSLANLDAALPPLGDQLLSAIDEFETVLLAVAANERKAFVATIEPMLEPYAPRTPGLAENPPARTLALALPIVAAIPSSADQLGELTLYKGEVQDKRGRSAIARADELLSIHGTLTKTGGFTPSTARKSAGINL